MWLKTLVALAFWVALVPHAFAQETQPPKESKEPAAPSLLLRMTNPPPAGPAEGIAKDDLRELPAPQMDRLPGSTRFHVVVGDKCLPGEGLEPLPTRRSSRNSRPR